MPFRNIVPRALSVGALVVLTLSHSGCRNSAFSPPLSPPAHLLIGWDASKSARKWLPAYVRAGARLVRRFEPDYDWVTMYRVDSETTEFFDEPPPGSILTVQNLLTSELADPPAKDGTSPWRFWKAVAERAAAIQRPVLIVLLTDGENDDQTKAGQHELRFAIARLAGNKNVRRVCVWGVERTSREALRRELSPLGNRLVLCGPLTMHPNQAMASLR
jgi:hypothetical protein